MQYQDRRSRLLGCLEDGVSVVLESKNSPDEFEVVSVSREEWRHWVVVVEKENQLEAEPLNFNQAA